jgi:hypothetical protein
VTVVADEKLDGTNVALQLLGERQRFTHQTRNALPQGVIETFNVIDCPGFLRDGLVSSHWNHALIGIILSHMQRGLLTVF